MSIMAKRVAVIGSGASGITAIKACLEEGLEPICYERSNVIGGLWYYTDKVSEGQSCVMKSTVINTSKEIMAYSDYLIPAEFPVFMHNTYVCKYLQDYAKHFSCVKHIRFEHEVMSMKLADTTTGMWQLVVKDTQHGTHTTEMFDAVFLCTGHHADKRLAHFEGLDGFKGKVVHAHDYRSHVGYEDKNVVVVGIGNSGGDIAVELARISKQVYLSTRRGSWVINRVAEGGYPFDLLAIRRCLNFVQKRIPTSLASAVVEKRRNARFNHANYSLKPKHRFLSQHPMVNDDLPNRIMCGSVKIRSNIKRITGSDVEFEDGRIETGIDVIILATGYNFGFPFIEHPALHVENNEVNLFKYVFAPDIQPCTLAVIGCIQPLGAVMPISELQCRWAVRVFKNDVCLPSPGDMWTDIRAKKKEMAARYDHSPRHTIQVDYITIMDEMAELTGCKPHWGKMLLSDPALALQCIFGPCVPYQYRLVGPHAWSGAREAIMTVWDRTLAPTRPINQENTQHQPVIFYILVVISLAVIIKCLLL